MTLSREEAGNLLTEWTQSESLRKHALAVEAAVRGYARQQGANEEEWAVVALLHDFDYERYPTLGDHPNKGCERSEEHTSELQSQSNLVCRLLLEKKKREPIPPAAWAYTLEVRVVDRGTCRTANRRIPFRV